MLKAPLPGTRDIVVMWNAHKLDKRVQASSALAAAHAQNLTNGATRPVSRCERELDSSARHRWEVLTVHAAVAVLRGRQLGHRMTCRRCIASTTPQL